MKITINDPFWEKYLKNSNNFYSKLFKSSGPQSSTKRVAIYLRVSTDEQATEGYSIEEQKRECLEFAEHHGWQVARIYSDEGCTGTNNQRPAFRRLLKDTQAGKFDGVITHKIDRAYRNAQSMLQTFSDWKKAGVFYVSIKENLDFTTPWGKLILGLLSLLAEIFVDNLREETKKGKQGRFQQGLHNGHIPWGYCDGHCSRCTDSNGQGYCPRFGLPDIHHGKHAVPHPIDSIAFRAAHQLYRTGDHSDKDIAEFLNDYQVQIDDQQTVNIRSKGKPGEPPGPFSKDTLRDILKNPFYTGVVPYYGSEYDGESVKKFTRPNDINEGLHTPIITQSEFDRALAVRELKRTVPQGQGRTNPEQSGKSAPRRAARVYVLQGLLDCARCGAPMHCQAGGGNTRRHNCSTRIQRRGVCNQPSTKADNLEAALATKIERLTLPQAWKEAVVGYVVADNGLEAIVAQRQACQQHFDLVQAQYESGQLGRQVYLKERRAYERAMSSLVLEAQTDIPLSQIRSLLADFGQLWPRLRPLEQKELARVLLRNAVYDAGHVTEWHWEAPFQALFSEGSA